MNPVKFYNFVRLYKRSPKGWKYLQRYDTFFCNTASSISRLLLLYFFHLFHFSSDSTILHQPRKIKACDSNVTLPTISYPLGPRRIKPDPRECYEARKRSRRVKRVSKTKPCPPFSSRQNSSFSPGHFIVPPFIVALPLAVSFRSSKL